MENSIIREAIQGFIDDSKIVDKLSAKLDCHRTEILEKVNDNFALESSANEVVTLEDLKVAIECVQSALNSIEDTYTDADEAYSYADNAKYNADNAKDYADDVLTKLGNWKARLKESKNVEETSEATIAPAKKTSSNMDKAVAEVFETNNADSESTDSDYCIK